MSGQDFKTPLSKVRGLGSAKEGTDHFWKQRITAFANVPLILFFVIFLIIYSGASYREVTAVLSNPIITVLFGLVILSGVVHMKLGMQVIIEDYIHSEGLKIVLLMGNIFFAILIGALSIFAILKLGFGG